MLSGVHAGRIIVVGSSTGGTEALRVFLSQMPVDAPPILIAQHMPESFVPAFAARLDGLCVLRVKMAEQGEEVKSGTAYISPGNVHMEIARHSPGYCIVLKDDPPVNFHRPSVEKLFRSAAQVLGIHALGVMLTGMGKDGAAAMLEMKQAGAINLAQNEESCVVFGMPRAAVELGAVDEVLPLDMIAGRAILRSREIQAGRERG
ncbi:MAG: CheB methylesterase domain-containing protein [Sideroxydans sp.]|nr:CheB methylesterase domain-containing protein [Sideroxydans sp.]